MYYEEEYTDLPFAKDGEVFDLDGKQTIVMGRAYSIDKMIQLMYGYGWWPDEQPSDEIKTYVESQLDKLDWKVDVLLRHTTLLKYEPVDVFLSGVTRVKWISLRKSGRMGLRTGCNTRNGTAGIIIKRRLCLRILMCFVEIRLWIFK